MLIEEELQQFLEHSIRPGNNKNRDKQIIAFYYGFGESSWPTLEDVAEAFGLNQRERARQIVRYKFQDVATSDSLPAASLAAAQIETVDFISAQEIEQLLTDSGLTGPDTSLRGLLNLLQDLGLCEEFNIYDVALRPASRASFNRNEAHFLVRSSLIPLLKRARKKVWTLPGLIGLAEVSYIARELGAFDHETTLQVISLLKADSAARFVGVENQRWFALEDRDNTLINSCEKLFKVVHACDSSILAHVLSNSLSKRTSRWEYPSEQVIKRFVETSRLFQLRGSVVTFRGNCTDLTAIEKDVIEYLHANGSVDYPQLRDHLLSKGYGKPHVDKAITCSPLVYVDKSQGRTRHTYQLVPLSCAEEEEPVDPAYQGIRTRLERLREFGTDIDCESSRRREQAILQDWLFSQKRVEQCAICGNTFACSALVAAHKKTRSTCSENERLDPYIVMPLCVFGCDYLYERGFLVVSSGTIELGKPMDSTHESSFATSLAGRKVAAQWLRGDPSYFARPQINSAYTKTQDAVYAEA